MEKLAVGILAHVDAGKTTLSEAILYRSGVIRKLGRVDHKDAFLDTEGMEKERGITIFSKQAVFPLGERTVTLLDTPGHVDFSAEMERTLSVLDYAILVISGTDGVQGHTETLWRLLARYQVPVFLFVNKMDQPGTDQAQIMQKLRAELDERCVDFSRDWHEDSFLEEAAMCEESLLETFLAEGDLSKEALAEAIRNRKMFPCFFGSALKLTGVDAFLEGLDALTQTPAYGPDFGARVFKISRDAAGTRLTYMKITGGSLRVKDEITGGNLRVKDEITGGSLRVKNEISGSLPTSVKGAGEAPAEWTEKADQLRIYSGARFEMVQEAGPGTVLAVTGLSYTYPGEGLGVEPDSALPVLEPVLTYQILPWGDQTPAKVYQALKRLEEEEPELHVVWNEKLQEIHAQLMGEVQIEVLKKRMQDRFGMSVECGPGHILYKETIASAAEGVGHYEPLRHYAEVHLLLEPGDLGSGITVHTACSEDVLDRNWQRLIMTHVEEREHVGVLTGSPVTDLKITILSGRAHEKHTEGGDFRQATYRAIRHGLKKAEGVLLEPWYDFRIEVQTELVGRVISDIQNRFGSFEAPESEGDMSILTGKAPVACLQDYATELAAFSKGRGRIRLTVRGYEPCHNPEEVIAEIGYDSELDPENPTGSVFCSHGAGFYVPWDLVEEYMHLPLATRKKSSSESWLGYSDGSAGYGAGLTGNPNGGLGNGESWPGYPNGGAGYGESWPGYPDGPAMRGESQASNQASYASGSSLKAGGKSTASGKGGSLPPSLALDKELEAIFEKTFGPISRKQSFAGYTELSPAGIQKNRSKKAAGDAADNGSRELALNHSKVSKDRYLLVDGYNIVHDWPVLKDLAADNLDAARGKLMDILCNYQGYKGCTLILVFDAYKVKGNLGTIEDYHNIHVVYTKEAETADEYIAKLTHEIGKKYPVTVATSDNLEQLIVMGQGAVRLSAQEFMDEVEAVSRDMHREYLDRQVPHKAYIQIDDEVRESVKISPDRDA